MCMHSTKHEKRTERFYQIGFSKNEFLKKDKQQPSTVQRFIWFFYVKKEEKKTETKPAEMWFNESSLFINPNFSSFIWSLFSLFAALVICATKKKIKPQE